MLTTADAASNARLASKRRSKPFSSSRSAANFASEAEAEARPVWFGGGRPIVAPSSRKNASDAAEAAAAGAGGSVTVIRALGLGGDMGPTVLTG